VDPRRIEGLGPGTYRNLAGLPDSNTGESLRTGRLSLAGLAAGAFETQIATAFDGNPGGLPEIRFLTTAEVQLYISDRVSVPAWPHYQGIRE
jgi:hypothetical protein